MAQLEQDEWPKDGEPTTTEEEDAAFKREGPNPPGKKTGHSRDDIELGADASVIDNAESLKDG
jgi:hypothetical protein